LPRIPTSDNESLTFHLQYIPSSYCTYWQYLWHKKYCIAVIIDVFCVQKNKNPRLTSHQVQSISIAEKMEPRFSLPAATPRSSKRELVIGGVKVYIYGLDELRRPSGVEIGALYLAYMRTRTYLVTEAIAHEVLHQYRAYEKEKRVELIAVTIDMRNHGEREVRTLLKGSRMYTSYLFCPG